MVREKFEGSFAKVLARAPRRGPSHAWAALRAGPLGQPTMRARVPHWAKPGCWAEWMATGPFSFSKAFLI